MTRALARLVAGRLLAGVPVLLAAVTLAFALVHLLPGDPVDAMIDTTAGGTPQQREALRHALRLDEPLPTQYLHYIGGLAHGDLGRSIQTGEPVVDMLGRTAPPSLALAGIALILALVVGVALALAQVVAPSRAVRRLARAAPPASLALPGYWIGILLMSVFAFGLGWLPATGDDGAASLVLPAVTLAVPPAAVFTAVLAASLREALAQSYVLTARARGAGPWRVVIHHALRNALTSTTTVAGLAVGQLLAGAVLVETVFSRPGLGRTVVTAVGQQDVPVLQGFVVFLAAVYVVVNLVVDLLYGAIDPRISLTAR